MPRKRSRFRQYLEIIVNAALIIVCLSLVGVLALRYLPLSDKPKSIKVGDKLSFPDLDLKKEQDTILLFLQTGCPYCTKSDKFYQEIADELADNSGLRLISVFSPNDSRSEEFLRKSGLQAFETHKTDFSALGIEGTPTIVIIDQNGIVKNVWKGLLTLKREIEVKKTLGLYVPELFIEESEVHGLLKKGNPVSVVDVRNREIYASTHFGGAKNIPLDELSVRAINELSPTDTVVVYGLSDYEGEDALEILNKEGFRNTYILNYKSP